ncbi:HAD family phosphatase [Candidatus Woesearchaeota archaeon]|nr:HAD family phosphatase [Candidatus Woesearchaeota archaeon]
MPKLIIFDLGGVVTSPAVETIDHRVADFLEVSTSELRSTTSEYKAELTKGNIGLIDVYTRVAEKLMLQLTPTEILTKHLGIYREALSEFNQNTLSVIERLKPTYTVVALANAEREVIPISIELGLYLHFEHYYISCELGIMKPDAIAYQTVLDDYHCLPEEAVFIDDKLENVQGAERLGIKGIHFTPKTDLEKELVKLGVKL